MRKKKLFNKTWSRRSFFTSINFVVTKYSHCIKMMTYQVKLALRFYFVFASVLPSLKDVAQKPIDTTAMKKWTSVRSPIISDDGKYASFIIENSPGNSQTLVVRATEGIWEKKIVGGNAPTFSSDSRYLIYSLPSQSRIVKIALGPGTELIVSEEATSFQLSNGILGDWITFQKGKNFDDLVLYNVQSGEQKIFSNVSNYVFDPKATELALAVRDIKNSTTILKLIDLKTYSAHDVWIGEKLSNVIYDSDGQQLAFIGDNTIEYYNKRMSTALTVFRSTDSATYGDRLITATPMWEFTKDGKSLVFGIQKRTRVPSQDPVGVNVWSYLDVELQSTQRKSFRNQANLASIELNSRKVKVLTFEKESVMMSSSDHSLLVVEKREGSSDEAYWNPFGVSEIYLVSPETGKRHTMAKGNGVTSLNVSAHGKFVIYYDKGERNFITYETQTGRKRNVTDGVSAQWWVSNNRTTVFEPYSFVYGTDGWLEDETAVFINSRNDIWMIDPSGVRPPMKLTNGEKLGTTFRLMKNYGVDLVADKKRIILQSFNNKTRCSGSYLLRIDKELSLRKLYEGSTTFNSRDANGQPDIVKAKNADAWLLLMGSSQSSYNYFFSRNLSTFSQVSHVNPEKEYIWMTTELRSFQLNGVDSTQGVLYKPQNFDSSRKYPVIIYCYESFSEELNMFKDPRHTGAVINIPHFVSNGYLVFAPDIKYGSSGTGPSALKTAEAAADYLASLTFVNSDKIGINGHSLGGYEINYIIAHSDKFVCALSGAGVSNLVSSFGELREAGDYSLGQSGQAVTERYYQMISPFWNSLQKYIDHSPVFSILNVTTPLLLIHNRNDGAVPFDQSIELFTALRRLGKKAWLLEYDNQDHAIFNNQAAQFDAETRFMQFFDHYLKDSLPPKWMTRGIRHADKGVINGFELDDEIKTPPEGGLLMREELRKKCKR
jgi:dipeptidyl aminopeptidase/acylaminoacyl peptidase